jgi:hypothetical protein
MAIAQLPLTHTFPVGETVTLTHFPEEGEFTVTAHTGHNIYNGLPCYHITAANGDTIQRITQPFISRK